ncbi:uncharacterized protein LOC34617969 [Cyclospora cayetanensis]|uniref:Uncharacterized protein LOC34617969 n=1 Tax=Cyclospora cayetanensis TaxID=88456 RepID=A0A6P6RR86_9EIME|nr:uncharacterized protein LOC34617969 [Cyclospora cayetanensis]
MDYATDKGESTRHVCICEICLLHPHLKAALRRMQPPELRLYSQNELLNLLECDVSMASENSEKHKIGSEESWWHLCTADRSFPIYIIPTEELVADLASYLAGRVQSLRSEMIGRAGTSCCRASEIAKTCTDNSCCSNWDPTGPIRILECGAGTGALAAHLMPRIQQLLHQGRSQTTSTTLVQQQQQRQQGQSCALHSRLQQREKQHRRNIGEKHDANADVGSSGPFVENNRLLTSAVHLQCTMVNESAASREAPSNSQFTYIASEPRQELQWCPQHLAPTAVGCRLAMQQHCPQMVICCWMPFNVDWTAPARSNCCACCRSILELGGAMPQQHHSCPCQVQEYILIGHPEGGLVGRPLETWGLNCPDADLLPLGVDYEACQDQAQAGGSSSISPASETHSREAASAVTSDENNDGVGIRKRRKTRTDDSTLDPVEWQPANNFKSILPDVPSRGKGAPKDAFGNDSDCEADSDSSLLDVHHSAREFGGMHLLPLSKRPYYREGFVRLPPLPTKSDKVAAKVAGATDLSQLEALQGVQSLSRFDSLLSLRAGFPSVSRVIVFRRTSKRGELG